MNSSALLKVIGSLSPAQRRALAADRDVLLRAGAGSGKTTVLTTRYLRLLELGRVAEGVDIPGRGDAHPLRPADIVTITFTRQAAAELRARIVANMRRCMTDDDDAGTRTRWRERLDALAGAYIGTIHGWCRQVLEEFAPRAGLDPGVEIADNLREREVLDAALAHALTPAEDSAEATEAISWLARRWDRDELEPIVARAIRDPDALDALLSRCDTLEHAERMVLFGETERAVAAWREALSKASPLARSIDALGATLMNANVTLQPNAKALTWLVAGRAAFAAISNNGALGDWLGHAHTLRRALFNNEGEPYADRNVWQYILGMKKADAVKRLEADAFLDWYRETTNRIQTLSAHAAPLPGLGDLALAPDLFRIALLAQRGRVHRDAALDRENLLTQDDLLRRTDRLLAQAPDVLATLRDRIRHIMVDEMQDTDPLQWRIVAAVAGLDATRPNRPGRLFLVGDAKQSIYRFRGADVSVLRMAEAALPAEGLLDLADNYRTLGAVLHPINELATEVFNDGDLTAWYAALPQPLQPAAATPNGDQGALTWLLYTLGDTDEMRKAWQHAHAVAKSVAWALTPTSGIRVRASEGGWRAPTPSDVMVLLRARTHLPALEVAFGLLGLPSITEQGVGFHQQPEVRDLRNALAWLADPRDDLAFVGLLRGPLVAWSDDLIAWLADRTGLTWWDRLLGVVERHEAPDGLTPHRRRNDAWAVLDETHRLLTRWLEMAPFFPLADLMQTLLEESGAWAAYGGGPEGAQRLANIDKLLAQARAAERPGWRGARELVAWLDRLDADDHREGLAEVPESQRDVVRLLTVHAAKGREAPIVVIGDALRAAAPDRDRWITWSEGTPAGPLRWMSMGPPAWLTPNDPKKKPTLFALHEATRDAAAERARAESRRLLYVAMTRARDHLLVTLPTAFTKSAEWATWMTERLGDDRAVTLANAQQTQSWPPGNGPVEAEGGGRVVDLDRVLAKEWDAVGETPSLSPTPADSVAAAQGAPAAPRAMAASRQLGMSAMALLDDDPRAFYWRVLLGRRETSDEPMTARGDFAAFVLGTMAHRAVFEGTTDRDALAALAKREILPLGLSPDDSRVAKALDRAVDKLTEWMARWRQSSLLNALEAWPGRVLREATLSLRYRDLLLAGRADIVAWRDDGPPLIVDVKTTRLSGVSSAEVAESMGYRLQLELYAMSLEMQAGERDMDLALISLHDGADIRWPWTVERRAMLRARLDRWDALLANNARGLRDHLALPPNDEPDITPAFLE